MLSNTDVLYSSKPSKLMAIIMRHSLNFITLLVATCACQLASGQTDTALIAETKKYVHYIDSINNLDHVQHIGFTTSTEDGIIKRDGETIGGFGIYTLSNARGDTAYRIEYHDNLDINLYKVYYFKSNRPIWATLYLQDGSRKMKTIYRREEYYRGENLLSALTQKEKEAESYLYKINISLFQDALKFLEDFQKENSHR